MSKKKFSNQNIVLSIVEIVLAIAILCTLAMPIFGGSYTNLIGDKSVVSIGVIDWLKQMVFEAESPNAWAIIITVLYFLTLLVDLVVLVFAVLGVFGISAKKMPKLAFEALLCVFAILFVVASAIYTGVDGFNIWLGTAASHSANASYSVVLSWAGYVIILCAFGACVTKALEK